LVVPVLHVVVKGFLNVFLFLLSLPIAFAQAETSSLQNTWSHYSDTSYDIQQVFLSLNHQARLLSQNQDHETRFSLGLNQKRVSLQKKDMKSKEIFGGRSTVDLQSVDAEISQNILSTLSFGLLGGMTRSQITSSRYYGIRATGWWLSDTLQTSLEYRKNSLDQLELDFTDVDGKRIQTPKNVDGSVLSAQIMQYVSKTTILSYGYSQTLQSDRPDAWGSNLELRQYAPQLDGALHLSYAHFENTSQADAITTYGQMVSNTFSAHWLQKLGLRYLIKSGYRLHQEIEKPRANVGINKQLGSDYLYTSLSYRMKERLWSQSSPEVSLLYGHYRNNQDNTGNLYSLGGTYLF
jgi:hypothetical protein